MGEVLQSARADGALWLLVIAFCVAAPVSEELFARGFLYRGWSESFLGPAGAIVLSSLVWTSLHLQYDWFFFGEVFSIGLLARLSPLSLQFDLADDIRARPQQSGRGGADHLAGGHEIEFLPLKALQRGLAQISPAGRARPAG